MFTSATRNHERDLRAPTMTNDKVLMTNQSRKPNAEGSGASDFGLHSSDLELHTSTLALRSSYFAIT
jgi:hypothetical protein